MREPICTVLADDWILFLLITIAFLWRAVVSLDGTEVLWESICSGISLIILGWLLLGYLYTMSRRPTQWPVSNKIYQRICFNLLVLNGYVLIYYGMRWSGVLHVEVSRPLDFVFRDIRYVLFVIFYAAILWSTKPLKKMHDDYRFLVSRSMLPERSLRELIFKVITDERTLLVLIGIAFLWRTCLSFDYMITFWESTYSYIIQLIIGWFLFGYLCALSVKVRKRVEVRMVSQGIAFALGAINVYALAYYGMMVYGLIGLRDMAETFMPMDYIFGDARFFALVLFYYTTIMISKYLEKAYADYTAPIVVPSIHSSNRAL
ncbi:MAG: hypothetical protein EFT35_09470 [Methanophagales archaeon ANME-1-THS]|nr:MAG: hypothetical protein EFT35_09470 [Methanophagales archaeon ANME-1-THS]